MNEDTKRFHHSKKNMSIYERQNMRYYATCVVDGFMSYEIAHENAQKCGLEKSLWMQIAKFRGTCIQHAPEDIRDDVNIVLAAIQECPGAYYWASKRLQGDLRIIDAVLDPEPLFNTYLLEDKVKSEPRVYMHLLRTHPDRSETSRSTLELL